MASKLINRRSLLRGLGGVAVALPMLEIMGVRSIPRASASPGGVAPKRYVFCFGAPSVAGDSNLYDANGQSIPNDAGFMIRPKTAGPNYDLPGGLAPLATYGVQDDISVVSGLTIPWGSGSSIPAAGRPHHFHTSSVIPQTTGRRVAEWDYVSNQEAVYTGPTSDQIVADEIAGNTRYRVLNYGVQNHGSSGYDSARLSWRQQNGQLTRVDNVTSPQLAYQTIFTGFVSADPTEALKAAAMLKRRQSVLDLVRGSTDRLLPRLGKADSQRLAQHFDEIRALETRLASLTQPTGAECRQYPDPGEPVDGQEDRRAELLTDIIHMAIACDLSRVATLQYLWANSSLNAKDIAGVDADCHAIGHYFDYDQVPQRTRLLAWQTKHFSRLVAKLKATPDVDGTTLLDNTALAMIFEAGFGIDPESGGTHSVHSTENMCVLVAGRAGGLKPGKHIVATGRHPGSAVLSAMRAAGSTQDLGEISSTIPELFT